METIVAVQEYLEDCQARGLAPATLRSYRWALALLEAHCPTLPRRGRQVRPLFAAATLGLEARHNLWAYLDRFFRWCGREYRAPNPMGEISRIRRERPLPRTLSLEEIASLWAAARDRTDQALIAVPLATGIRLGEIASMVWPSIGPGHLEVNGKVGRRDVPLSPQVQRLLLGLGDGYHVWVGQMGPLTAGGLQQRYFRLFREAGIFHRKNGPHTLRHTFATLFIARGGNVFRLQWIMGHRSIKTTERYVHLAQRYTGQDHAAYTIIEDLPLDEETV